MKYSLVIPTKNRARYAIHAVRSALACRHESFEVVVQDCSDDDALKDALAERGLIDRIVYRRSPSSASMTENWNNAVASSSGDWVSIFGDDDAILSDSLSWADLFLGGRGADVLACGTSLYRWPDYGLPGVQNYLRVGMSLDTVLINDLRARLRRSLANSADIGSVPSIYHGFASRDFLERQKARRGAYFVDRLPDFDFGHAVLMYADQVMATKRNMFVSGIGFDSNSGAMRFHRKQRAHWAEYSDVDEKALFEDGDFKDITMISNRATIVASKMRLLPEARAALDDPDLQIDLTQAWRYMAGGVGERHTRDGTEEEMRLLTRLAAVWNVPADPSAFSAFKDTASLSEMQGLNATRAGRDDMAVVVNGNICGLENAFDAAVLTQSMIPAVYRAPDKQAHKAFNAAKTDAPDRLNAQARDLIEQAEYGEAQAALTESLRTDPRSLDAIGALADLLIREENYAYAEVLVAYGLSLSETPALRAKHAAIIAKLT